jgi:hypothetical protein
VPLCAFGSGHLATLPPSALPTVPSGIKCFSSDRTHAACPARVRLKERRPPGPRDASWGPSKLCTLRADRANPSSRPRPRASFSDEKTRHGRRCPRPVTDLGRPRHRAASRSTIGNASCPCLRPGRLLDSESNDEGPGRPDPDPQLDTQRVTELPAPAQCNRDPQAQLSQKSPAERRCEDHDHDGTVPAVPPDHPARSCPGRLLRPETLDFGSGGGGRGGDYVVGPRAGAVMPRARNPGFQAQSVTRDSERGVTLSFEKGLRELKLLNSSIGYWRTFVGGIFFP